MKHQHDPEGFRWLWRWLLFGAGMFIVMTPEVPALIRELWRGENPVKDPKQNPSSLRPWPETKVGPAE
jgi:hypothetical protein